MVAQEIFMINAHFRLRFCLNTCEGRTTAAPIQPAERLISKSEVTLNT